MPVQLNTKSNRNKYAYPLIECVISPMRKVNICTIMWVLLKFVPKQE